MHRSFVLRPISVAIILGVIFGTALLSQVFHRNSAEQDTVPVGLTRAQVADSVAVVSNFCDRVIAQPDWKPARAIHADGADTVALVEDVCGQLGTGSASLSALFDGEGFVGSDAPSRASISEVTTH